MTDVARILSAIDQSGPRAAEHPLPLVGGGLRKLAAAEFAHEKPSQPLRRLSRTSEATYTGFEIRTAVEERNGPGSRMPMWNTHSGLSRGHRST